MTFCFSHSYGAGLVVFIFVLQCILVFFLFDVFLPSRSGCGVFRLLLMGIVGKNLNIEFVVSTGDNFYDDGLKGVDDPAFYESFVHIYTAPSLQQIWYNGKLKKLGFEYFLEKICLFLRSSKQNLVSKLSGYKTSLINKEIIICNYILDT
ncbi:putative Acid phosphatase [Medicago truncatula]|uniref:Putative Acid phosphatase n=1 Tax=Medicago truncatula TaxID=3880 RepID=A0A396GMJ7_MEDTR|nr:putative Acid phosphatase [Medicago truncatula]